MWRLHLALLTSLTCSASQRAPAESDPVANATGNRNLSLRAALPDWLTTLIRRSPPESMPGVEEVTFRGQRAFHIMPADRVVDSGNEHVLYSEEGRIICEFGGLVGLVTTGSCDIGEIKFVRTIRRRS